MENFRTYTEKQKQERSHDEKLLYAVYIDELISHFQNMKKVCSFLGSFYLPLYALVCYTRNTVDTEHLASDRYHHSITFRADALKFAQYYFQSLVSDHFTWSGCTTGDN